MFDVVLYSVSVAWHHRGILCKCILSFKALDLFSRQLQNSSISRVREDNYHGIKITSHASIAYHKQLRTVGTIGRVWQESAPLKETTGPEQTDTQSETMITNNRKWQTAHARPLLEPAGYSQLVLVLDL